MNNVTIIIVSYNTKSLLEAAYRSLRRFYPVIPVIIVDNSEKNNTCYPYARSIKNPFTTILSNGRNAGHGPGMKLGIGHCKTEYFLLMDSDVTINKAGVLEAMISVCPGYYGTGQIMQVCAKGANVESGIPYLHPHFALINKREYLKCAPIINHGAPMLKAMISLPVLAEFPVSNFVTHHERGTRKLNPKSFHPKNWDKI